MPAGVWLQDLTWPEAKARFDEGAVVLVPVGAASKEHGHHLPLETDALLARHLAARVMATLPVVVAPVVGFGYYPAFVRYPGSQHLRSETFIALMTDILRKFVDDGVERLAVLNTGVSTEAPLRIVVRDLYAATGVRVGVADLRLLGKRSAAGARPATGRPCRRGRDLDGPVHRAWARAHGAGAAGLRTDARGGAVGLLSADGLRWRSRGRAGLLDDWDQRGPHPGDAREGRGPAGRGLT